MKSEDIGTWVLRVGRARRIVRSRAVSLAITSVSVLLTVALSLSLSLSLFLSHTRARNEDGLNASTQRIRDAHTRAHTRERTGCT